MKIKARWHFILVAALVVSWGGAVVGCRAAPPVVLKFSSSPTQIDAGESAMLTWVVKDATSVSIDQGIGVVGDVGNKEVSPSATTTYTLIASNSGGAVAASVVVTVDATSPPDSDTTAPVITSVLASFVTETSAVIAWTTDEPATSQVEYGTTGSYGSTTTLDEELVTSHSVSVTGLEGDTAYHFRVKSQDGAGNEAVSTDETFTTSAEADTTPPVISGVVVSNITESGATIRWTTDESATSQVMIEDPDGLCTWTEPDESLVTDHSVALGGLEASTTYHYTVISADESENEATSEGHLVTSAQADILALEDVLVRLDELPSGWYQGAFQEYPEGLGEYRVGGCEVVFRNKKYAAAEEEISIANRIWLCEEEQAAMYLFEEDKRHFAEIQQVALGDDAFFASVSDSHCEIHLVKGLLLVWLEYYGVPLAAVSETERFEFLCDLAAKVEGRIPSTVP